MARTWAVIAEPVAEHAARGVVVLITTGVLAVRQFAVVAMSVAIAPVVAVVRLEALVAMAMMPDVV